MNLVDRVRNILLTPRTEWAVIDAEPASIQELYARYVIPLTLVPAVAGFIGGSIVGIGFPGVGTIRVGVLAGLFGAVLQFGLLLAFVYILALVINELALMFGGRMDIVAAFKAAAYSSTPAWLAGVFSIVPVFAFLSVVGLYSLYLLYLGLPRLMRAPDNRAVADTAAGVGAAAVPAFVVSGVRGLAGGARIAV
ncbi:MAG: Yip1 family protein [Microvirga sp.]